MRAFTSKISSELVLIGLISTFFFYAHKYKAREFENWTGIFNSDVNGYYMYLPGLFIHGNMDLSFTESDEFKDEYRALKQFAMYHGSYDKNGEKFTKYYVGTAVLQAPFFIAALIYTQFSPSLSDGYSIPFQVAVFMAALFYFLAGLYFVKQLLLNMGFKPWVSILTIVILALGTNLFNYVWNEPGMSHVYVFCCIAVFLYFAHAFFQKNNTSDLLKAAIFLGLVCIIRPTSVLIIVGLPLLAGSLDNLKQGFQS